MPPSATSCWACCTNGFVRIHMASMQNRSRARASAITSRASRAVSVNAFSTSTGLPARSASSACSW